MKEQMKGLHGIIFAPPHVSCLSLGRDLSYAGESLNNSSVFCLSFEMNLKLVNDMHVREIKLAK